MDLVWYKGLTYGPCLVLGVTYGPCLLYRCLTIQLYLHPMMGISALCLGRSVCVCVYVCVFVSVCVSLSLCVFRYIHTYLRMLFFLTSVTGYLVCAPSSIGTATVNLPHLISLTLTCVHLGFTEVGYMDKGFPRKAPLVYVWCKWGPGNARDTYTADNVIICTCEKV